MSSHSYHHPQDVLLAQFSLYVHKSGLKPDSFHFYGAANYAHNYAASVRVHIPCVDTNPELFITLKTQRYIISEMHKRELMYF